MASPADPSYNPLKNALYFEQGLSDGQIWSCNRCLSHVILNDSVIASNRYGLNGRSLLAGDAINIRAGDPERAELDLGAHIISRVTCARCRAPLGCKIMRVPSADLERTVGKYLVDVRSVQKTLYPY